MKTKYLINSTFILLLSFSLITFNSCKKDTVNESSNLGSFFDDNLTNAVQNFTINGSSWTEIIGSQGTKILFGANSFQDASGNVVTGNIDIELVELLSIKDMILMDKPTTSNGRILTTGGELNVNAFQNGQKLSLTPNSYIDIKVPTDNPYNNMRLFLGVTDNNGDVDWLPADTLGVTDSVIIINDSTVNGGWADYYYFDLYGALNLGWINCDYFYNDPNPLTSLTVTPNNRHDNTNTQVWLHIATANSLMGTGWNGTSFITSNIPETISVTIVALSEIGGNYFSSFTPITVSNNHVENITLSPTTTSQFLTDVNNL